MLVLAEFTNVKLDAVQTRPEHHGEALVTAIDLTMTWTTNNRALHMLHADARDSFFCALATPDPAVDKKGQKGMDLPVDEMPNLRFAKLAYPLKFEQEQIGMSLEVDYGLGSKKSNIHLALCKVKNHKITPIEGGSIEWKWTVSSAADLTEKIIGVLAMQAQHDISVKLLPPEPGSEGEELARKHAQNLGDEETGNPEGGDWPFPGGPAKQPDATDLFREAHGHEAEAAAATEKAAKPPKAAAKKTPAKKAAAKKPAANKKAKA